MKVAFIILVMIMTVSGYGQIHPDIRIDKLPKTSEFYIGKYFRTSGLGGSYWKVNRDYSLKFGQFTDVAPSSDAKEIGLWSLYEDTLIFRIEKRTFYNPAIIGSKKKPHFEKFKTINFKWVTELDLKTENNHPITLTTYCTVLLTEHVDENQLEDDLAKFVKDNLKVEEIDGDALVPYQIDQILQTEQLIQLFFFEKRMFCMIKTYKNGSLTVFPYLGALKMPVD
ncbi:MAG: hypothetical protein KIT62_00220 [Cyclobacteriaceae bacterium]|nr:hypothetical protein [Cyclobacteriaceae bacterium]